MDTGPSFKPPRRKRHQNWWRNRCDRVSIPYLSGGSEKLVILLKEWSFQKLVHLKGKMPKNMQSNAVIPQQCQEEDSDSYTRETKQSLPKGRAVHKRATSSGQDSAVPPHLHLHGGQPGLCVSHMLWEGGAEGGVRSRSPLSVGHVDQIGPFSIINTSWMMEIFSDGLWSQFYL